MLPGFCAITLLEAAEEAAVGGGQLGGQMSITSRAYSPSCHDKKMDGEKAFQYVHMCVVCICVAKG